MSPTTRLRRVLHAAPKRLRGGWPRALQAATGASLAWFVMHDLLGHAQPFFAPITVVVCLAVGVGTRGRQAVRLLAGVVAGVALGEAAFTTLGGGIVQVFAAVSLPMLAGFAFRLKPVIVIQTASSALIVIGQQSHGSAAERLFDAAVGGAIALLISQVLFPPRPTTYLADEAETILRGLRDILRCLARAVRGGSGEVARDAVAQARAIATRLGDLADAASTGQRINRWTLAPGRRGETWARLDALVRDLDLVSAGTLLLAHGLEQRMEAGQTVPNSLAAAADLLGEACAALAEAPGDARARERAGILTEKARAALGPDDDALVRLTMTIAGDLAQAPRLD